MNLKNIILSKRSQRQKSTYSMITFICKVQNGQIHSGGCRNNGWL